MMPDRPIEGLRGKFIVVDGVDGAGKGVQIDLMRCSLESKGV